MFYVTFPYQTEKRHKYYPISAMTYESARKIARTLFGNDWAFIYTEEEFHGQIKRYGLTLLKDVL